MHGWTQKRKAAHLDGRGRLDRDRFVPKNYDNRACLFIKSLRPQATVEAIRQLFEEYGPVNYVVLKDKLLQAKTGPVSAKFGFINFEHEHSAHVAVREAKFRPELLKLINQQIAKNDEFLLYYQDKESRPEQTSVQKAFGRHNHHTKAASRVYPPQPRQPETHSGHVSTAERYHRGRDADARPTPNPKPQTPEYFSSYSDTDQSFSPQAAFDLPQQAAYPGQALAHLPARQSSSRATAPAKAFELFPLTQAPRKSRPQLPPGLPRTGCSPARLRPPETPPLAAWHAPSDWLLHDPDRFAALPTDQQLDVLTKVISKKLVSLLQDISILPMVMDIIATTQTHDVSHLYRCALDESTLVKQVNLAYALLGEEASGDAENESSP